MKKTVNVLIVVLLFASTGIAMSSPRSSNSAAPFANGGATLYVGGDGPGNYTSIQDAIDDANSGDTVFVYNGTYYENVVVDTSINLIGEDRDTTVIDGSGSGTVVWISASFVNLCGFTVTNGGQTLWDHGITMSNEADVHILDCVVTGNSGGVRFNSGSYSSIVDCYIHNNSANSITVYRDPVYPENITIRNCTIADNGASNVPGSVFLKGYNVSISDCHIYNNWNEGIVLLLVHNADIHHNTIYGNTGEGINVHGYSGPVSDVVIHDNEMTDRIYFADCDGAVTVRDNNASGVLTRRSSGNVICGNNFTGQGVYLADESSYNVVSGNDIVNSSGYGVRLVGSANNTIYNNDVTGSSGYGIHISLTSPQNNITGNTVVGNGNVGVYLKSDNNTIVGNVIVGNGDDGVFMAHSSNNTISGNNISGNNGDGIDIVVISENNEISCNAIVNNTYVGIRATFDEVNDNIIYHNNLINNQAGNAYDIGNNFWDNGYPDGGNYWDDFDEPDEGAWDNNSDGFVDDPYDIPGDSDNQDRYPFMYQDGWLLNYPPYTPSDPDPYDGAIKVSVDVVLSWIGGDPNPSDNVTYDVYFGVNSPPSQVVWNQTENTYNPGILDYNMQYYWKIVAWDNHNTSTTGSIWSFTTEEIPDTEPPNIVVVKPMNALYIFNKKILPFFIPLSIGGIDIMVDATDNISGVDRVEFSIDDELEGTDYETPYVWTWDIRTPLRFRHTIKVTAFDNAGNQKSDEITVWKFF